ncbi:unnamed protein product [Acanthoscelides obtectus]|uniref:Uncharacterized protein n=1 Tax=Acanthoscelides obtectus TaxID=200917 RepID=A0A9P0JHQ3_ACAOB|nr:unnamed protein product [Acanthoscelides obtectus]CAK1678549.1 hypothetical protein AOBTE_LOCUS31951 [Acanthoscelides obtectus]
MCSFYSYKAVKRRDFARRMSTHPKAPARDVVPSHIQSLHCSTSFEDKPALDVHVLKKHPDFVASVTSIIHECQECSFMHSYIRVEGRLNYIH